MSPVAVTFVAFVGIISLIGFQKTHGTSDLRGQSGTLSPNVAIGSSSVYNTHKLEIWFDSGFVNTEESATVMFLIEPGEKSPVGHTNNFAVCDCPGQYFRCCLFVF